MRKTDQNRILASTGFSSNWDFAMGIMNCLLRPHFARNFLTVTTKIDPSNQYLPS